MEKGGISEWHSVLRYEIKISNALAMFTFGLYGCSKEASSVDVIGTNLRGEGPVLSPCKVSS